MLFNNRRTLNALPWPVDVWRFLTLLQSVASYVDVVAVIPLREPPFCKQLPYCAVQQAHRTLKPNAWPVDVWAYIAALPDFALICCIHPMNGHFANRARGKVPGKVCKWNTTAFSWRTHLDLARWAGLQLYTVVWVHVSWKVHTRLRKGWDSCWGQLLQWPRTVAAARDIQQQLLLQN